MAWTAPRTWIASEVVTASLMNTHIRDNLDYLKGSPSLTTLTLSGGAGAAALTVPATGRLYLDGGTNTWIEEASADTIGIVCGGTTRLSVTGAGHVFMNAATRLYLDGGSDTWIEELAANQVGVVCENTTRFTVRTDAVVVPATNKVYLDGGGDTYLVESSANNLRCVSGGTGGVELTSGATSWSAVSDERLKIILETIASAADKVATLRAVIGRFASDDDAVRRPMLIAQDVQRVLPEAVTEGEDGYLRLASTEVIPLLVAAIQELTARVAALEARGR